MWSIFLLSIALVEAQQSHPLSINTSLKSLHNNPFTSTTSKLLKTRDLNLSKRQCQGTCSECFGSGYTSCPGSDYYCYKPGDPTYGLDSCDSSSSSGSDSGSSTTCASEYGSSYTECPNDSTYCYDTTDSSGSLSCYGDHTTTDYCTEGSSCSTCFGSGYETCPDDSGYCYQPGNATSCCPGSCDDSTGGAGGSSYSSSYSYSDSYTTPTTAYGDVPTAFMSSSYAYPTETMTTEEYSVPAYTEMSTTSDDVPTETGDSVPTSSSVEQSAGGAADLGVPVLTFGLTVVGWLFSLF